MYPHSSPLYHILHWVTFLNSDPFSKTDGSDSFKQLKRFSLKPFIQRESRKKVVISSFFFFSQAESWNLVMFSLFIKPKSSHICVFVSVSVCVCRVVHVRWRERARVHALVQRARRKQKAVMQEVWQPTKGHARVICIYNC